jgi:ribose/xylose/arabinose/galactoside ABC-type transport system permease subunit
MTERPPPSRLPLSALVHRFGIYCAVLVLVVTGAFLSPKFLTANNLLNTVDGVMLLGIVAVGAAFVTYSGHYADLSVPTTMAFSGVMAVEMLRFGFVPGLLAGLATGLVIGLLNALMIGKLRSNPIIWTLAMSYVTKGLMRWIWLNRQIYPDVKGGDTSAGRLFVDLYRHSVLGRVTLPMVVLVVLAVAGQYLLKRTAFGQQLKLVGSNQAMAAATGVNVPRTVGAAFLLSSLAASAGGILITSLSKVGAYYNGEGYDFDAVTAIVIGGVTLAGGRGDIIGVLGGVLMLGLMSNIMTLMGVDTFAQRIVKGLVFIAVVGVSAAVARQLGRDDA